MKTVGIVIASVVFSLVLNAGEKKSQDRKPASGTFGCFLNGVIAGSALNDISTGVIIGACDTGKPFSLTIPNKDQLLVCCTGR